MTNINKITIYNLIFFLRAIILLAPITLLFYQHNGLGAKELFFFQGIFYLTSILFEPPIGYLSNIISGKKLLLSSFIIYLSVIVSWIYFRGYYIILLGEVFCAISKVIMDNVMSGYLYCFLQNKEKENKMPKHYGYLNFSLALGTTVASILGTFLFSKFGFNILLTAQSFIIIVSILLLSLMPNIQNKKTKKSFINSLQNFSKTIKLILNNKNIKYHIFLSGFLTAYSILFVLSFQLIIIKTSLPIFIFGAIALTNHGLRAIASLSSNTFFKRFDLSQIAKILFILYVIAFFLILFTYHTQNKLIALATMVLICIFIGLQLIFTILHISRAHAFIKNSQRGSLMSVNNFISRTSTMAILLSSKIFIDKYFYFDIYYIILFIIYLIIASVLTYKITNLGTNK